MYEAKTATAAGMPTTTEVNAFRAYLDQKAIVLESEDRSRFAVPYDPEMSNFGFSDNQKLREALKYLNILEINILDDTKKEVRTVNLLDPNDITSTYEEFMKSNPHDTKLIVDFGLHA